MTEAALYDMDLARVVALECDGSYQGALAVCSVVYNRLDSGVWGDTIKAVLSAENQFSVWHNRDRAVITDTVRQACIDAYKGVRNLPESVLWFCTPGHYRVSRFFKGLTVYDRFAGAVWCEEDTK
jgi:spore germination cell wall hydrolase CwlJ-like protein